MIYLVCKILLCYLKNYDLLLLINLFRYEINNDKYVCK